MTTAVTPPPVFGTVLIVRSPQDSPSPLELQMRHKSARSRIVQKLSGGAHLLLPSSDSTIAVRAYFTKDLDKKSDDDLVAFRNAFKYPIVFFILPAQREPLSDMDSFVIRAQRIMNNLDATSSQQKASTHGYVCMSDGGIILMTFSSLVQQEGSAHVYIVPDVASAVTILSTVVQSLTPERRELKRQFCENIQSRNFVDTNKDAETAAWYVTRSFRAWAERFELSTGAADVLMGRLNSLGRIASADRNMLDGIPALEESSKATLQEFFGSGPCISQPRTAQPNSTRAQEIHLKPPPRCGVMNVPAYQTPQETHLTPPRYENNARAPFQTPPQDSIVGMMQSEESMGFSQFGGWEEPATPQLLSQQYMPMSGNPMHRGPVYRPIMSPPNVASQRPLLTFNRQMSSRNGRMGNRVRPMSTYSVASEGYPSQGYYG